MVINKMLIRNLIYILAMATVSVVYEHTRESIQQAIISAIDYVLYQPIGIKHNRIIKAAFGRYCKLFITPEWSYNMLSSLRVCIHVASTLYRHVFSLLGEMIDLLKNRTYNPQMKRYDIIHLQTDQIALTVVLVSILLVIFSNLVIPYFFFAVVHLMIELVLISWEFFDDITSVGSYRLALIKAQQRWNVLLSDRRGIFTGNLRCRACVL